MHVPCCSLKFLIEVSNVQVNQHFKLQTTTSANIVEFLAEKSVIFFYPGGEIRRKLTIISISCHIHTHAKDTDTEAQMQNQLKRYSSCR